MPATEKIGSKRRQPHPGLLRVSFICLHVLLSCCLFFGCVPSGHPDGTLTAPVSDSSTTALPPSHAVPSETVAASSVEESTPADGPITPDSAHLMAGSSVQNSVELIRISDRVWMHVTHEETDTGLRGHNGLVLIGEDGAVLCGTTWNADQTDNLLSLVESQFNVPVRDVVVTQSLGIWENGMNALSGRGLPIHALRVVADQAARMRLPVPDQVHEPETDAAEFILCGMELELFWPGSAHTSDNTVLWFRQEKILYAGSIVKDMETTQLGSVQLSVLEDRLDSIALLEKRYPDVECIVPDVGQWGTAELFEHTRELVSVVE